MGAPQLDTPYLDPAFVARVVADPDPLPRNAAITRGHHALSEAVAALLGREHANWLTFGQWASAEARESITGSTVPRVVRPFFGHEIAAAVASGNAAIFGDVAPPFVRFVTLFTAAGGSPRAVAAARAAMLADPRIAASEDLARAFVAYADAFELLAAGGAQFPPALKHLRDPEALALARRFGQDLDSAARSDAPDWEDYAERMGFILTLLRSHQGDPALFALPPGTPDADTA